MGTKPAKVRRDIRISPALDAWIDSLPPRYGDGFSEKARTLLEIAREYLDAEQRAIISELAERKQQAE